MAPGDPHGDSPHLPEVRPIRPEDDPQVQAEVRERRAACVRRWRTRGKKSAPFLILVLAWYVLMSATQRESVRAVVLADLIHSRWDYYVAVEGGRDPSPQLLARLRATHTGSGVAAKSEAPPPDEDGPIAGSSQDDHAICIGVDRIRFVLPFLATADVCRSEGLSGAGYRMVVVWTGRWRVVSRELTLMT